VVSALLLTQPYIPILSHDRIKRRSCRATSIFPIDARFSRLRVPSIIKLAFKKHQNNTETEYALISYPLNQIKIAFLEIAAKNIRLCHYFQAH